MLDPPRPPRAEAPAEDLANPYRGAAVLWRIHAVSVLLVVPQTVMWTFTLVWLMTDRGWSAVSAGTLVTVAQLLGAGGRVAAGYWSDRVRHRLRPIRSIALAAAATMALLALTDALGSPVSVALMVVASVITVSDNGLAFTAIAEIAGPFWSGRALGAQNTSQHLASAVAAPAFGGADRYRRLSGGIRGVRRAAAHRRAAGTRRRRNRPQRSRFAVHAVRNWAS